MEILKIRNPVFSIFFFFHTSVVNPSRFREKLYKKNRFYTALYHFTIFKERLKAK